MIEPLTASLAFATVVGLLSDFKSERSSSAEDEYKEFVDWLSEKRHRSIVKRINENDELSRSIRQLLTQSHNEVIAKLENIDSVLIGVASRMQSFSTIANATSNTQGISEQSVSILKQFVDSEASFLIQTTTTLGVVHLIVGDGNGGNINIETQRFLHDDMNSLVECGLIKADSNSNGERLWRITRNAVLFIDQLELN